MSGDATDSGGKSADQIAPVINALLDSTRWNRITFRDDDIIIAAWPRSGTTWMQQIITQLIFGPDPELFGQAVSPWVECRFIRGARVAEAQQHRRVMKSHLPAGALPLVPRVKYVFIARDPRDMFLSWHRQQIQMSDAAYELLNRTPGERKVKLERPDPDFATAFESWLDQDNAFVGPFWPNCQSWWNVRDYPNVLLVHYSDMTADLETTVSRLGAFLAVEVDTQQLPLIRRYCTLGHMRALAGRNQTLDWSFRGGGEAFVNGGNGGGWRSSLALEALEKLEATARKHLSPSCARWLFSPLTDPSSGKN